MISLAPAGQADVNGIPFGERSVNHWSRYTLPILPVSSIFQSRWRQKMEAGIDPIAPVNAFYARERMTRSRHYF
jgi:hypothetical protein